MDNIVSSAPTARDGLGVGRVVRLVAGWVVVVAALTVLGVGIIAPLTVLEGRGLAAGVGAASAVLGVFVASGLFTLAAVLWEAPPGEIDEDDLRGPRVSPVRKKAALTPAASARMLSALDQRAQQTYVSKRVRSTSAANRNTAYLSSPTRTYFVELRDPSGLAPDLYASLTKEGKHDEFEVPSRQRVRETYEALASGSGRVGEAVYEPFADVTLVCGERDAALVDSSIPLTKLEHPDLRDEWRTTPGLFDLFAGVPTVRLVDVLNDYGQPGVGVRVNEGWASAWVASSEPRNRRVEQLGHALMHLTSLPQDYEFLYGRSSDGKGSDPVLRTLRSDTIARTAATLRDVAGIVAIIVTGLITLLAYLESGPEHWVGEFWRAAMVQAGALIVVGMVVVNLRPDRASRQRRVGKQVIELAEDLDWRVRRSVPYVAPAFPWAPFSAVHGLAASPIADYEAPVDNAARYAGAEVRAGAAYLYGDIGRWPTRRPFAARAVWVTVDTVLPRVDIVDRAFPKRVTRTIAGEEVTLEHFAGAQRWHLFADNAGAGQLALAGRAAALLDELPPGTIAIHVVDDTVMVWDNTVLSKVALAERYRWATRFAKVLAR